MTDIGRYIYNYGKRNNVLRASAMPNLKTSEKFFRDLKINIAVEIGTYKGLSASYIAQFANEVHTFDVTDFSEKYKIWKDLEVIDKIFFYVIKGRDKEGVVKNFKGVVPKNKNAKDIKMILDKLEFNFAFIDAFHDYKNVKADFELVKKCGRVLFHDIEPEFKGVHKFANEIGVKTVFHNVGYWEAR